MKRLDAINTKDMLMVMAKNTDSIRLPVTPKRVVKQYQIRATLSEECDAAINQWCKMTGLKPTQIIKTALVAYARMKPKERIKWTVAYDDWESEGCPFRDSD